MSYLWIFLFASLAIQAKAQGFDLADAVDDDVPTKAPIPKDKKKSNDDGFDLNDALLPDPAEPDPKKPAVNPNAGTGGGSFDDSDLTDLLGGGDSYKPDKGKDGYGGGGHIRPPPPDYDGGKDYDNVPKKDLELPWALILKQLSANMPESVHIWISNLKGVVLPLLEKLMELIDEEAALLGTRR
ncbi:hypothetical protein COCON_G00047120 [Conger conger]|uniref:Uncharacterized protein n=1 Tax=Conger conger TaxID=82655 RepID=A0A9Q1I597_CONCO|nr:hypothetical protein COCON_G00047120 [Conger conger]